MPADEGQPRDLTPTTGEAPPPTAAEELDHLLTGRQPLPHAEEKGAFFVYQRELAPGTRLEQYEIISVLGSGGFGITYLAKDLFLNRNVVIKENFPTGCSYRDPLTGRIRPNNEHDLENYAWALKSFLKEAQTLAELNHQGIVRILSVFEANGTAYFAMEHITGLSLDYLGEKLHSTGHRYTEDELKGLLSRLLKILDYLHANHIYHRDIKPGNILLTEQGTPVLIDFGAARHALKMNAATVLTTQGYSSPEQALGKNNIGPWSDLYSVGATFYALLTGQPPERAEGRLAEDGMPPLHSDPQLTRFYSRQFLLSLDKALAPQINCRYQNAREWLRDINAISGGESSATIHMMPADFRNGHGAAPVNPSSGHARIPRPVQEAPAVSARTLKKNRRITYLLAGSIGTLLLGAGAVYLLDYVKQAPMGTTINTIKGAIQQPPAIADPAMPGLPRDLSSIRIPELKIADDATLELRTLTRFTLRLNDSTLSAGGLPTPLPVELRISCIYLQVQPPKDTARAIYLTIRDKAGSLVGRSVNPAPSFTIPGHSTATFFFPALPTLETERNYSYTFETADSKPVAVDLACFKSDPSHTNNAFPKIRLITAPAVQDEAFMTAPANQALIRTFSAATQAEMERAAHLNVTADNLAAIGALAKAGYPLAQYRLAKTLLTPGGPHANRGEEGVEWLYRAATGGCYEAMKDLGIMLTDMPSTFPLLPQNPPLAKRDYAQAARFLRMAVQYRDPEALYLLSLMYSQGWGVPISSELSRLMLERLNGSSYLIGDLNPRSPIAAYWLNLPVASGQSTLLKFTVPGPYAPETLRGITLHNTCREYSFSISTVNVLQNGRSILNIIAPQEITPGKTSRSLGVSIPAGMLEDTTLPLTLEIQLTPGASCGVVTMPQAPERQTPPGEQTTR